MKKTILTTFICSVIVMGVALSGFVIYDRFLSNDNEPNNQETNQNNNNNNENNNQNNEKYFNSDTLSETSYISKYYKKTATAYGDVSKYSNVFEYFQDLESLSIKLDYATNEIKEETGYETIYHRSEYNLTNNEINNFLNDMEITKQKLTGGFGMTHNATYLYISYKINNKVHTTKLMTGMWMLQETTDGNIYKIIDNNLPESDWDVLLIADKGSDTLTNIVDRLKNK